MRNPAQQIGQSGARSGDFQGWGTIRMVSEGNGVIICTAEEGHVRLGPLKDQLPYYLRRAQDACFHGFARRFGQSELHPGCITILTIINENPGINQTTLSQATGRDKSTLTPALKGLEEQRLVVRTRSETDRRAYHLHLTAAGKAHLDALLIEAEAYSRALDEIVGEFNKPLLVHLLEKIATELEELPAEELSPA